MTGSRSVEEPRARHEWGGATVPLPAADDVGAGPLDHLQFQGAPSGTRAAIPAVSLALYRSLEFRAAHAVCAQRPGRRPPADLVHEVVVRALLGLGKWRAECDIGTWLFRIACNELARRERKELAATVGRAWLAREPSPSRVCTPEDDCAARDRCCGIASALGRLSWRRRLCLLGLSVWDLGADEVGDAVGMTPGAVREAARKGRIQLRRMLDRAAARHGPPQALPVCSMRQGAEACSAAIDGWRRCPPVVPPTLAARLARHRDEKRGDAARRRRV